MDQALRQRQFYAVLFAVLIAIVYLRLSQLDGRLAADLGFDDVGYANDAVRRLMIAHEQGFFRFLATFVENPPHSPFATLLAVFGFVFGGLQDASIYAANTLVLVGVAAFLTYELRYARRAVLMLALGLVMLSPLAYRTICDFRPDMALGLTTAVMAWWFIGGSVAGEPRLIRRAGYAFGLCLLIKPSFFAHTIAIAMFLVGMAVAVKLSRRCPSIVKGNVKYRDVAWFLGLGITISLPYFVVNGEQTFHYFWENTQGAQSEIWSFPEKMSLLNIIKSFLCDREFTFRLLGYHLFFSIIALVMCGTLLFLRGAKADAVRIAAMGATALVSLVIIASGRHRNEFFLAAFQWMLLLTAAFAIAALDQRLNPRGKQRLMFVNVAVLVLTIWMNRTLVSRPNSPESVHSTSWNKRLIALIQQHEGTHDREGSGTAAATLFLPFAGPVNAETLFWTAAQDGLRVNAFDQHSADIAAARVSAENSHYVILPNELRSDYYRWLPNTSIQSEMLEWVLGDSRFQPLSELTLDSHYFVFANLRLFTTKANTVVLDRLATMWGFLNEEGPYPQWSLPRVRWMSKNDAKLCIFGSPPVAHRFILRFRSDAAGQLYISDSENTKVAAVQLHPSKFSEISTEYTPKSPKTCLIFAATIPKPVDPERLILFSKIEFLVK
jgi:hypothetical protein